MERNQITDLFNRKKIPIAFYLIEKMVKSNQVSTIMLHKSTHYNTNFHIKNYVFYKRIL